MRRISWIVVLGLCVLLAGCGSAGTETAGDGGQTRQSPGNVENYTATNFAMGTLVSESLFTTGEDISQNIVDALTDVEDNLLSWRKDGSEIAKINASAGDGQGCQVSASAVGCLRQVLELAKESGGALDPTIGLLIREWDIDGENPHVPEQSVIDALLEDSGYESVRLEGDRVWLPEDMTLDLGAVGKGIGCDRVREFLEQDEQVSGALISLGGSSIMTYGQKEDGTPWKVAVLDPRSEEGDYLGVLTLEGSYFISTSGDYEKYFEQDGVRYHHILNPADGYPSRSGLISVTIVSRTESGLVCDGLSTACMVLGLDGARELLARHEVQAVLVDEDKKVYTVGEGQELFELTNDSYVCEEE